jgi:transcription elongation GreA/GreB family factor
MAALKHKTALKVELLAALDEALAAARRAHQAAVEGATHGEAKPENDKDTRGLEQSYLARGQALRIEALEAELADTQALALKDFGPTAPISVGALVTVEDEGLVRRYFVAPHGGGLKLLRGTVQVVTPRSPVGQALVGRRRDDECEVLLQGKRRSVVVTGVE